MRFRLRTLFVALTLCCLAPVWLSGQFRIVQERQAARKWILDRGGYAVGVQRNGVMLVPPGKLSRFPSWRRWLGDEPIVWIGSKSRLSIDETETIHRLFPESLLMP